MPSSASNPAEQQHPRRGILLDVPETVDFGSNFEGGNFETQLRLLRNRFGESRSEPGPDRRSHSRSRSPHRSAPITIPEHALPPGERMSYFSRRNRNLWTGLSSRSPSRSPPPPPTRTRTSMGLPTRSPTGPRTWMSPIDDLDRRADRFIEFVRSLRDQGLLEPRQSLRDETIHHERLFEAWRQDRKNDIRSKSDYKSLMEQIEPLTELGEEQEKLESAMQNISTSVRKQGLRIWFRMWVAWVPRKSATSNDEGSEDKLDEMSREIVKRDRACSRWERQKFLKWEKQTCAVEDEGAVVDRDLEEEEVKATLAKQEFWAYELDRLNISSQVAWEMQMSHGVGWAILGHEDDGRRGQLLVAEPGDLVVPAFNARDLLELPELWIQVAPGKAGPKNEDTPMGKAGRFVTNHPPFLPTCIVFDGLRLFRTGKFYAGYIEYRTRDLENENAPRARLILSVHRHGHKLGPGNGNKNGGR